MATELSPNRERLLSREEAELRYLAVKRILCLVCAPPLLVFSVVALTSASHRSRALELAAVYVVVLAVILRYLKYKIQRRLAADAQSFSQSIGLAGAGATLPNRPRIRIRVRGSRWSIILFAVVLVLSGARAWLIVQRVPSRGGAISPTALAIPLPPANGPFYSPTPGTYAGTVTTVRSLGFDDPPGRVYSGAWTITRTCSIGPCPYELAESTDSGPVAGQLVLGHDGWTANLAVERSWCNVTPDGRRVAAYWQVHRTLVVRFSADARTAVAGERNYASGDGCGSAVTTHRWTMSLVSTPAP